MEINNDIYFHWNVRVDSSMSIFHICIVSFCVCKWHNQCKSCQLNHWKTTGALNEAWWCGARYFTAMVFFAVPPCANRNCLAFRILSPHFLFFLLDNVQSAFSLEHFPQSLSTLHKTKIFVGKYSSHPQDYRRSKSSFVWFQVKSYFFFWSRSPLSDFILLYEVPAFLKYILNKSVELSARVILSSFLQLYCLKLLFQWHLN